MEKDAKRLRELNEFVGEFELRKETNVILESGNEINNATTTSTNLTQLPPRALLLAASNASNSALNKVSTQNTLYADDDEDGEIKKNQSIDELKKSKTSDSIDTNFSSSIDQNDFSMTSISNANLFKADFDENSRESMTTTMTDKKPEFYLGSRSTNNESENEAKNDESTTTTDESGQIVDN